MVKWTRFVDYWTNESKLLSILKEVWVITGAGRGMGAHIDKAAVDWFGRIDMLVNNAGEEFLTTKDSI